MVFVLDLRRLRRWKPSPGGESQVVDLESLEELGAEI